MTDECRKVTHIQMKLLAHGTSTVITDCAVAREAAEAARSEIVVEKRILVSTATVIDFCLDMKDLYVGSYKQWFRNDIGTTC